jgi:hypothetical protein
LAFSHFLLAPAIFLSLNSYAQIQKGTWLLGGTLGFNSANANSISTLNLNASNSSSNTNLAPHIAYAIGNNSVIGLDLAYNYDYGSLGTHNTSFSSYLFYKKYIPCQGKFGFYIQANGGINLYRNSYLEGDSSGSTTRITSSTHSYYTGVIPGVYYQVGKKILLEADCGGLAYIYYDFGPEEWESNLSFNFLSNFTFGVDFILGKK